jgi:hypothetical protein
LAFTVAPPAAAVIPTSAAAPPETTSGGANGNGMASASPKKEPLTLSNSDLFFGVGADGGVSGFFLFAA